jgi:hypothetical protein
MCKKSAGEFRGIFRRETETTFMHLVSKQGARGGINKIERHLAGQTK